LVLDLRFLDLASEFSGIIPFYNIKVSDLGYADSSEWFIGHQLPVVSAFADCCVEITEIETANTIPRMIITKDLVAYIN